MKLNNECPICGKRSISPSNQYCREHKMMKPEQSDEKWYEFITEGSGIDFGVCWVQGLNPSNALINYCKYTEEIKGAHMEAICSLCFESAIQLANEWLDNKIINIHEIADEIFSVSDCRIETI